MESQIPFSEGVGKRKTKLEVRIPFTHIVDWKRLALRYTHSSTLETERFQNVAFLKGSTFETAFEEVWMTGENAL